MLLVDKDQRGRMVGRMGCVNSEMGWMGKAAPDKDAGLRDESHRPLQCAVGAMEAPRTSFMSRSRLVGSHGL